MVNLELTQSKNSAEVKALRNTSPAKRQAAKLCYRFGPLTPSARSASLIAGDGTENGFPAPNKELVTNPKQLFDRKSPIFSSRESGANPTGAELDAEGAARIGDEQAAIDIYEKEP